MAFQLKKCKPAFSAGLNVSKTLLMQIGIMYPIEHSHHHYFISYQLLYGEHDYFLDTSSEAVSRL
jgi:hypothetical protein